MDDAGRAKRIGDNIKKLRNIFGMSQNDLALALGVNKSTVSMWEGGQREPQKDKLDIIADIFFTSVDNIVNNIVSDSVEISSNPYLFWDNIDIIFPIIQSDAAMKDRRFKHANDLHKEIYDELKKRKSIGQWEICIDIYKELLKKDGVRSEAAANLVSFWILYRLFLKDFVSFEYFEDIEYVFPAVYHKYIKNNPDIKKDLEGIDDIESKTKAKEVLEEMNSQAELSKFYGYLRIMRESSDYADLAYYYVALLYIFGFSGGRHGVGVDSANGFDMIMAFSILGNKYAQGYLKYIDSMITRSQNADDK